MKIKKNYPEEYKIQAVKLAADLGSVVEAGRQLGIDDANIHNWKRKYSSQDVTASRKPEKKPDELMRENQKLIQENAQLKKINHILKAAAAFFSQDHLK